MFALNTLLLCAPPASSFFFANSFVICYYIFEILSISTPPSPVTLVEYTS